MGFRICGRLSRFVLGGRDKMRLGSGGMRWRTVWKRLVSSCYPCRDFIIRVIRRKNTNV